MCDRSEFSFSLFQFSKKSIYTMFRASSFIYRILWPIRPCENYIIQIMAYESRHKVFYNMIVTRSGSITTPSSGHLENYVAMVPNTMRADVRRGNPVGLMMALL